MQTKQLLIRFQQIKIDFIPNITERKRIALVYLGKDPFWNGEIGLEFYYGFPSLFLTNLFLPICTKIYKE